jgi:hypothetical protein
MLPLIIIRAALVMLAGLLVFLPLSIILIKAVAKKLGD